MDASNSQDFDWLLEFLPSKSDDDRVLGLLTGSGPMPFVPAVGDRAEFVAPGANIAGVVKSRSIYFDAPVAEHKQGHVVKTAAVRGRYEIRVYIEVTP